MIELDGGVTLPFPMKAKGFTKPSGFSRKRWEESKPDMWKRAYQHCLHSLHSLFGDSMHTVVPKLSKKMLEATDPHSVALRFLGEMQIAGYIVIAVGFNKRVVRPTKKFLNLNLESIKPPETAIRLPDLEHERIPQIPVRGGINNNDNKKVFKVVYSISKELFEVNEYILQLVRDFPPEFKSDGSGYMFRRCLFSIDEFRGKKFRFPQFLDSRGRTYSSTTVGFGPQGSDYEKALVIPAYSETLTVAGHGALYEAALGYSEIPWSIEEMILHAKDPHTYESEWTKADKPYSYMSCANLLYRYSQDPSQKLPAFIPLDGRCSGLQHWSAITRSNSITRYIGMHKEEAELDIYEKIAEDWRDSLVPEDKKYATRKAVKIPAMTWAYNATVQTTKDHIQSLFGARKEWCTVEEKYVVVGEGLDWKEVNRLSEDLFRQLNLTLFPLSNAVAWLSQCARVIAKKGNAEIYWITTDGFKAKQRKVIGKEIKVSCCLSNGKMFSLGLLDFTSNKPNVAKHISSLAPNVVHGNDAAHLRKVAERLSEKGRPMIFIHDSFATHCNYREELYSSITETFRDLYSSNYLLMLHKYWEDSYDVGLELPPELGDWDQNLIVDLGKFFI